MTSERLNRGNLVNQKQIDDCRLQFYRKARKSKDLKDEELWYNSVFHSITYADLLVKEIWQKYTRRNSYGKTTSISSFDEEELGCDLSKVSVTFSISIYDLFKICDYDQRLVLVRALTVENLLGFLHEDHLRAMRDFIELIETIAHEPTYGNLYKLSSRCRIDKARIKLQELLIKVFDCS